MKEKRLSIPSSVVNAIINEILWDMKIRRYCVAFERGSSRRTNWYMGHLTASTVPNRYLEHFLLLKVTRPR